MANRLLNYNPEFWARTALRLLMTRKGMFSRVHRGYEAERNDYGLGETIHIRRPGTFVAADAPNSPLQDLKTGTVKIELDRYKEVPFAVTDRELAIGGQRLIDEHIAPATDAIAQYWDEELFKLASTVPHTIDLPSGVAATMPATLAAARRIMVDNKVPKQAQIHYMATSLTMERALGTSAFTQQQGAGDQGVTAQNTGVLGPKYGFHFFESHNNPVLEGDAILAPTGTKTVNGTPQKNATVIQLNTTAAQSEELHEGQIVAITDITTGITERYAITADVPASGNNWPDVPISPPLRRDLGAGSTWALVSTVGLVGTVPNYEADLAFTKDAFAAVMVPLPMHEDMGVRMYTAYDADTGLAIRARMGYQIREAQHIVVLDTLGGMGVLDPDQALRGCVH